VTALAFWPLGALIGATNASQESIQGGKIVLAPRGPRRHARDYNFLGSKFSASLILLLVLALNSCFDGRSALLADNELAGSQSAGASAPANPNSGIYGEKSAAWGNQPAAPAVYECVKVFDAVGQQVVATATCSGTWGDFRVPLPPGHYVIEAGGSWESFNGAVRFRPNRSTVEIKPAEWVKIAPASAPPGPVP